MPTGWQDVLRRGRPRICASSGLVWYGLFLGLPSARLGRGRWIRAGFPGFNSSAVPLARWQDYRRRWESPTDRQAAARVTSQLEGGRRCPAEVSQRPERGFQECAVSPCPASPSSFPSLPWGAADYINSLHLSVRWTGDTRTRTRKKPPDIHSEFGGPNSLFPVLKALVADITQFMLLLPFIVWRLNFLTIERASQTDFILSFSPLHLAQT